MAPTPAPPAPPQPPPTRTRHGAHRGGGGLAAALVPSLLAVAAVAALIAALAVWQAEEPSRPGSVAAATQRALRDAPAASAPAGSDPATTAPPAATAASSPPSAGTTAESPAGSPAESRAADDAVVRSSVEVVVLNQTSRAGLAGSVAERLRGIGWTVPAVGNFTGVVPATTVYYPPGAQGEALAVARDLPTEPRTRPRFGNLSTTRLTVVVTDSYPG